jgi:hypothetical protein
MFCMQYQEYAGERVRERIKPIERGAMQIVSAYNILAGGPFNSRRDFLLVRTANKMARMIRDLLIGHNNYWPTISPHLYLSVDVVEMFRPWFATHLRPIMWRLPEHGIPGLADQGLRYKVMKYLVPEEDMPLAKRNNFTILETSLVVPPLCQYYLL